MIRLGDGTEESAARMGDAVEDLHLYTDELFEPGQVTDALPDRAALRPAWEATVDHIFGEAMLSRPVIPHPQTGGRAGVHGEDLGHMLAEMQSLHREHPGVTW